MRYWREMLLLVIYFIFQLAAFVSVTIGIAFIFEYYKIDMLSGYAFLFMFGAFGPIYLWKDFVKMDHYLYRRRKMRDNNGK